MQIPETLEVNMKLKKAFYLLLIVLAMPVAAAAQTGAAQEVQKLERRWLDAYEQHDDKAMSIIVADDFTITFPDGSVLPSHR